MVQELETFRQKYPDYNDVSDGELAVMLAKKYPDSYGDLPGKVAPVKPASESQPPMLSSHLTPAQTSQLNNLESEGFGRSGGTRQDVMGIATTNSTADTARIRREYVDKPIQSMKASAGQAASMLAFPVASAVDAINGDDTNKEALTRSIEDFTAQKEQAAPDESVGFAGRFVRSLEELAPVMAAGPAGVPLIVAEGVAGKGVELADKGVDNTTNTFLSSLAGVTSYAFTKLPFTGSSMTSSVVRGATMNPVVGAIGRLAEKTVLDANDYDAIADSIKVIDPQAAPQEIAMGMLFGYLGGRGKPLAGKTAADNFVPFWDTVQNSNWYREKTIPERGLVVQDVKTVYDNLMSKGYSEADIAKMGASYFKEAVFRRSVQENKEAAGDVPPETAEDMGPQERHPNAVDVPHTGITEDSVSVDDAIKLASREVTGPMETPSVISPVINPVPMATITPENLIKPSVEVLPESKPYYLAKPEFQPQMEQLVSSVEMPLQVPVAPEQIQPPEPDAILRSAQEVEQAPVLSPTPEQAGINALEGGQRQSVPPPTEQPAAQMQVTTPTAPALSPMAEKAMALKNRVATPEVSLTYAELFPDGKWRKADITTTVDNAIEYTQSRIDTLAALAKSKGKTDILNRGFTSNEIDPSTIRGIKETANDFLNSSDPDIKKVIKPGLSLNKRKALAVDMSIKAHISDITEQLDQFHQITAGNTAPDTGSNPAVSPVSTLTQNGERAAALPGKQPAPFVTNSGEASNTVIDTPISSPEKANLPNTGIPAADSSVSNDKIVTGGNTQFAGIIPAVPQGGNETLHPADSQDWWNGLQRLEQKSLLVSVGSTIPPGVKWAHIPAETKSMITKERLDTGTTSSAITERGTSPVTPPNTVDSIIQRVTIEAEERAKGRNTYEPSDIPRSVRESEEAGSTGDAGSRRNAADVARRGQERLFSDTGLARPKQPEAGNVAHTDEQETFFRAVKNHEESELKQWAVDNDKAIPADGFKVAWERDGKIGETEHKVAFNPDGKTIRKYSTAAVNHTWNDYLNRLALHNSLFPSTAYTFKGVSELDGKLHLVVDQPWIKGADIVPATREAISAAMGQRGFERTIRPQYRNKPAYADVDFAQMWVRPEDGIVVFDVGPKNVYMNSKTGTLFFIDPMIETTKEGQVADTSPKTDEKQPTTDTTTTESDTVENTPDTANQEHLTPSEYTPRIDELDLTGIKNSVTKDEHPDLDKWDYTVDQVFEEGRKKVSDDMGFNPRQLAKDIVNDPHMVVTPEEEAGLFYDRRRLQNEHKAMTDKLIKATETDDKVALIELAQHRARLEEELHHNAQAVTYLGTSWSAFGRIRQAMMAEDYSLSWTVQRVQAALGKPDIPADVRSGLETLTRNFEEAQKKLAEREAKIVELEDRRQAQVVVERIRLTGKPDKRGSDRKALDAEYQDLSKQLNSILGRVNMGLDPAAVVLLGKMAKVKALTGIKTAAEIVEDIYKDINPTTGLERRDIRDAISGYGKTSKMTSDEISKDLREVRRKMRLISALEDAEAGEVPLKSGVQRDPVSDEVRNLQRMIRDSMREHGTDSKPTQSPEEQWKTASDSIKARLKNEIYDLGKQIYTGKRDRKERSKVEYDDETKALKAIRDEKKKLLDSIDAVPPKTEEELQSAALKAYKTRTATRIAELEKALESGNFEKKARRVLKMDDEAMRLKNEAGKLKDAIDNEVRKQQMAARTGYEKTLDWGLKWRRAIILSGTATVLKLSTAASVRLVLTPMEEIIGSGLRRVPYLKDIADKAPREGAGFNVRAEAESFVNWFNMQTLRDMADTVKTGRQSIDRFSGKKVEHDPGMLEFFGRVHGALKVAPKRAEFFRSLQLRTEHAIANGVDVSTPGNQAMLFAASYVDANRAIFMDDNTIVTGYKLFRNYLNNKGGVGKLGAFALGMQFPIIKVPTNFVAEVTSYSFGLLKAGFRGYRSGGREKMTADDADYVMRNLKKQGMGMAFLGVALGMAATGMITAGGYYEPFEKRKEGEPKAGGLQLLGVDIPKAMLHWPLVELGQIAATVARTIDHYAEWNKDPKHANKKKDGAAFDGLLLAAKGLLEEIPFLGTTERTLSSFKSAENAKKWAYQFGESLVIPPDIRKLAKASDSAGNETIPREIQSFGDTVRGSLPGQRGTLAVDVEKYKRLPFHRAKEIYENAPPEVQAELSQAWYRKDSAHRRLRNR